MPVAPSSASQKFTCSEPTITRNSPTNPEVAGNPMDAMVKNRKNVA